jgi:hypothetical protein
VKHGDGSSAPSAEANPVHAHVLNMDDGTQHHRLQTDPIMADLSDDDDVGIQMRVKTSTKFKSSMKVNKQSFQGIVAPLFRSFYVSYQTNGGLEEGSNRAFAQRV